MAAKLKFDWADRPMVEPFDPTVIIPWVCGAIILACAFLIGVMGP